MTCFKGPTSFPQRPTKRPGTDPAAWMTWDMLRWFVTTVFDPFAACVDANAGGGGYVFIDRQEVPTSDESGTLTFSDIPQIYRHLRLFLNLGGATGGVQPRLQWNSIDDNYVTIGQTGAALAATPGTPTTFYSPAGAENGVAFSCGNDLPETSLASFGPQMSYASFVLDFPYYTIPTAGPWARQASVVFNGSGNADDDENYWTASGTGLYVLGEGPDDAITSLFLQGDGGSDDFQGGSFGDLYGLI